MTSHGNGEPPRYKVTVSEHISGVIKQLHQQASQQSKGQQLLAALLSPGVIDK
jgi:hypothetical protein